MTDPPSPSDHPRQARRPRVSVHTITYNHEQYIEAAVESALSQETRFEIEMVVGEDCSTDGTRAKLLELQRRHPDRLRLLLHPTNVGIMRNFVATLEACRGEYIALLEGDDYWTDPGKLQKQVELLDAHPECAFCHHNVLKHVEGEAGPRTLWHPSNAPSRWQSLDELLRSNLAISCSTVFRAGLIGTFPDWFLQASAPDWLLHILNAQHGRIWYDNSVMAAYRVHGTSVWSTSPRITQLERMIANAGLVRGSLTPQQQKTLDGSIARWQEEVIERLIESGRSGEAADYSGKHLPDSRALSRLEAFFAGLRCEERGDRRGASRQLFRALVTGIGRTRIRSTDVLLALFRNLTPRLYSLTRDAWRRRANDNPPGTLQ